MEGNKMKKLFFTLLILISIITNGQKIEPILANNATYLVDLKKEMQVEWPKNRTINIVFHGHSVPSGYFKTPLVNTMGAYPNLFLKKLKAIYLLQW